MDTKLKRWKAAVSMIALLVGLGAVIAGVFNSFRYVRAWDTRVSERVNYLINRDYQVSEQFRTQIEQELLNFLAMATGESLPHIWYNESYYDYYPGSIGNTISQGTTYSYNDKNDYSYSYDGSSMPTPPNAPPQNATEAELEDWEYSMEDWRQDLEDWKELQQELAENQWNGYKKPTAEEIKQEADTYYKSISGDKNILFYVSSPGKQAYTNDAELFKNGIPTSNMPQGYNFALSFTNGKAEVIKDGVSLDIYKDGVYRENSQWRLPGYRNYDVSESAKKATVYILAEKVPAQYIDGGTGYHNNRLYQLDRNLKWASFDMLYAAAFLGIGLLLLIISFIFRKHRRLANSGLAALTKRIPIEVKLAVLALDLIGLMALPFIRNHSFGMDMVEISEMVWSYLSNGSYSVIALVIFILGLLLLYPIFVDLRYNKGQFSNGIFAKLRLKLFRFPFQKRLSMNGTLTLILGCVSLFLCIVIGGFLVYDYNFQFLVIIMPLFFILSVWVVVQFIASRDGVAAAKDTGMLIERITAIHSGNITQSIPIPHDSDLALACRELDEIRHGLQKAVDEQMKSERMKVALVANVSHDIKTPLTSIISYLDLLKQETDLPAHVQDYIHVLDDKAARLKTMVQDVFEVSKAASAQLSVTLEKLDYSKLLRQTLADMEEQIAGSGLTFKTDIPIEPIFIMADGSRMYRVFQNLLQNVLKYALSGSRVFVSLKLESGTAIASIKNISAAQLTEGTDFTERFVRGDDSRTDGGNGLGLSIAKSFTEACGGSFGVSVDADLFTTWVSFSVNEM